MSSDFSPELKAELLEDFYAECDELLSGIRVQLAHLDGPASVGPAVRVALESVYRSVHTLKGICAIVGLRPAENLAHGTEGLLRGLSRAATSLDSETLDLLGSAIQHLDQIIAAHRLNQPLPGVEVISARLRQYKESPGQPAPVAGGGKSADDDYTGPAAAQAETMESWVATFLPSRELDARGINIKSVRLRISALGTITRAAPVVLPGGTVQFEFHLLLSRPPAELESWKADGIVLRPGSPLHDSSPTGAAPPSENAHPTLAIAPSPIVRVELTRLDELMRIVGEMVIHRSRLEDRIQHSSGDRAALQEVNLNLGRSLRELREAITRVRMVPVAEIFTRLPFAVRDLGRSTGRKVRLTLEGEDTEIDKYVVERLKEPLLHLVRNAVSHGVEPPSDRLAAGKPEEATILLRAAADGQWIVIEINDDGCGIDAKAIVARAAASGEPIGGAPTDAELLEVLCRAGFSTREEADFAAGRGVGMAVVHNTVRELGGTLSMQTRRGQWTRFTLRLPLTLSIAETFLVSAAGQTCAIPHRFVEEIIMVAEAQVRIIQQAEVISYRDGVLPLIRLRSLFRASPANVSQQPVLVVSSERGLAGLVVDRVHGQREVVVRSMSDPLLRVRGIAGATELGDGRPVLILDPVDLTSGVVRPVSRAGSSARFPMHATTLAAVS